MGWNWTFLSHLFSGELPNTAFVSNQHLRVKNQHSVQKLEVPPVTSYQVNVTGINLFEHRYILVL